MQAASVLDISDSVLLDGINSNNDLPGGISSRMGAFSSGTAGDIWINAAQIEVTNGARLNATNAGPGNAGNIIFSYSWPMPALMEAL